MNCKCFVEGVIIVLFIGYRMWWFKTASDWLESNPRSSSGREDRHH